MEVTINQNGSMTMTFTQVEVLGMFKSYGTSVVTTELSQDPAIAFDKPKESPFYKGMKGHIKDFLNDLYTEYGNTPFSPKDKKFKDIRYKHHITAIGGIFKRLQETGHAIVDSNGAEDYHKKRYNRIQLWW